VAGPTNESIRQTCDEIHGRTGVFPTIVEVVPGEADTCLGVSLVADHRSEPVVAYCVRRLRLYTYVRDMCRTARGTSHPYELGSLVFCESHHDAEAMEKAFALVKAARYFGPITVEFRRNVVDGRLMLIKCDPRVVRATSLSTALGLDIPQAVYNAFTGAASAAPRTQYREGVGWLWISQYAEAIWNNREDVAVRRELLRLFGAIWRVRAFAFLSLSDPLPFFTHLAWRMRQRLAIRRRFQRASAKPAAT
jgi:predicted ATP-grasp superfamily ATP-dependent carboligase